MIGSQTFLFVGIVNGKFEIHAENTDREDGLDQGEPHVYILDPETGESSAFGLTKLLINSTFTVDRRQSAPEVEVPEGAHGLCMSADPLCFLVNRQ